MKRHWASVAAMGVGLALGWAFAPSLAQDQGSEGRTRQGGERGPREVRPGGPMGLRPGMPGGGFMIARGPAGGVLPDFTLGLPDLTETQRKQIAEIRRAALAKVQEIEGQMNADIKKLLTAEQAKAMEEARRRVTHRGPGGVILTDEQKKILDDARTAAEKANSREARAEIMRAAFEKVTASYTEEQKKQADEMRRRFEGRAGEGPRRGEREGGPGGDRDRPQRPE